MSEETVTVSFKMDRELYNHYKSVIAKSGQNVKGNLVRYMKQVVEYGITESSNPDTILAIQEVQFLKNDPDKKVYHSFSEVLDEIGKEEQE